MPLQKLYVKGVPRYVLLLFAISFQHKATVESLEKSAFFEDTLIPSFILYITNFFKDNLD